MAEALVTAIRTLSSDNGYKKIESLIDEIPLLRDQIESKIKEVDDLRAEIISLKTRHEDRLQENLELYRAQHNKLEGEKTELGENVSTLEATIRERDDAVMKLNGTQHGLQGQLDLLKKSLGEERKQVTNANTAITNLQQSLKAKDTDIDRLKETLRTEKTQVSDAKSRLQDIQKENIDLEQKLESSTTRLREVEGFATKLNDEDETVRLERLDKLWGSAHQLVEAQFIQDLPDKSFEDLDAWIKLGKNQYIDKDDLIPLPRSNSAAAKRMRIAAILAILARCINQHIFQPTYILDEEDEIRPLLVRLAAVKSGKESFCRALLLSIFPEEQTENAMKAVERVVKEVTSYVRDLLSVAQYENFRLGLKEVAQQACDAWRSMQYAKEKFELFFDLTYYEDLPWQALRFEEGGAGPREPTSTGIFEGDKELLVIFPRVYVVEDAEPDPISNGVVLMKSQSTAAAKEIERKNPSSPTAGKAVPRPRPNRSRTKSSSLNGGSDFLSQPTPSSV